MLMDNIGERSNGSYGGVGGFLCPWVDGDRTMDEGREQAERYIE